MTGDQRWAKDDRCVLNRCNRPQGIGTWAYVRTERDGGEQAFPVCEEHWEALRQVGVARMMKARVR